MPQLRDGFFFDFVLFIHKFFEGVVLVVKSLDGVFIKSDFGLKRRTLFFKVGEIDVFFL